jgi:hypothetical protein
MFFGTGTVSGDSYQYEWVLVVTSDSANVLYDEASSGDAGDESSPQDLGTLGTGTYTILGSLCFGGACGSFDPGDAYCFEVPTGLEISSGQVTITNVVGVGANARIREWDAMCDLVSTVESLGAIGQGEHSLTSTVESLGAIGQGEHSLTAVPIPGDARYGPGMFFGTGTVSDDSYQYEWRFQVTEILVAVEKRTWGLIKLMYDRD